MIINNLLNFLRIPFRNTFNTFFSSYMENKLDDVLNDEENTIAIIRSLQEILFPDTVMEPK